MVIHTSRMSELSPVRSRGTSRSVLAAGSIGTWGWLEIAFLDLQAALRTGTPGAQQFVSSGPPGKAGGWNHWRRSQELEVWTGDLGGALFCHLLAAQPRAGL